MENKKKHTHTRKKGREGRTATEAGREGEGASGILLTQAWDEPGELQELACLTPPYTGNEPRREGGTLAARWLVSGDNIGALCIENRGLYEDSLDCVMLG